MMQGWPQLRGLTSHRTPAQVVYTGQLDAISGSTVDTAVLAAAGLISNAFVEVKLIVKGDISKAKTIRLQSASVSAIAAIEKAGGSFETTDRASRPTSMKKKEKREKK